MLRKEFLLLSSVAAFCSIALGAAPAGLVDWASPGNGAHATSSHDSPLCWGPPLGTFADGLPRYCTSVGAAFDGVEKTFWAEGGGMDAELPHPSPAAPSWLRVEFGAPVRLRGARFVVGASMNYTIEVSSGPDGPWRVMATHTCDQDKGCSLGFDASYCGGYDPSPDATRREAIYEFDTHDRVTHARWRNTWASLGGFACGDVCLWSNLVFEVELWGDATEQLGVSLNSGTCVAEGDEQLERVLQGAEEAISKVAAT
jgi:hypothetical protein